jgi:alpha-methylacyl-CoA racemase
MQPLEGILVVDLSRYLPGAFAGAELLRLGARVVHVEGPEGEPTREMAPGQHRVLYAGKESVVVDLKKDPSLAHALLARADVVLEGFRPGVAAKLGVGPDDAPETAVYCSISGYGEGNRHANRAGHDLNYVGYAGLLEDTAPAMPPIQIGDIAAGSLAAVVEILAALVARGRTGRGRRVTISITHGAHRLASYRLGGDPVPKFLTGGIACYRIYETADGRHLTIGALEHKFWQRLCELVELPELEGRAYEERLPALEARIRERPLAEWLELFEDEDVCTGPVATLAEAAADLGEAELGPEPALGEHTDAWKKELGL